MWRGPQQAQVRIQQVRALRETGRFQEFRGTVVQLNYTK